MNRQPCRLQVDHSERCARLLELLRQTEAFDVQMVRLDVGDYLIDGGVLVERKNYADLAVSQ